MPKLFRNIVVLLFFLGYHGYLIALEPDFIMGKLIDSITQEPVVFAAIRIKDRSLGVISNADGGFKIPARFKESQEFIEISCMG